MFLGTEFNLAPDMPFDREKYHQWRCYWDFGAGMFTDLFVHRTTAMLKATGLRFPGRVVGAGGIYFEYDDRDVPDVATVVADFPEGVQGLVTATMCCQKTPVPQIIRGHFGSFVLGNGEDISGYNFVAERPEVTHNSKLKDDTYEVEGLKNSSLTHFTNFVDSAKAGKPEDVNCTPELGAAAMVIVKLGSKSYREGKAFHFDGEKMQVSDGNTSWAQRWEKMSKERAAAKHIPGWKGGEMAASSSRTNTRSWPVLDRWRRSGGKRRVDNAGAWKKAASQEGCAPKRSTMRLLSVCRPCGRYSFHLYLRAECGRPNGHPRRSWRR